MIVLPGGLLIFAAYVLARSVAAHMKTEHGPQGLRFARAVQSVRLRDVWANTRKSLDW